MSIKRTIQIACNRVVPNAYNFVLFAIKNHYFCNLQQPESFNEKIQWRKKYQHDARFPDLVDKWKVREFVAQIAPEILIETYGVYKKIDDIDFTRIPDGFIIKPTHGFGKVIICEDKSDFDEKAARKTMQSWLKYNQFDITGEWQYRDLMPRIIIDKLIGNNIKDYKFFCFDGQPYAVQIDSDRYINHTRQIRDINWNVIPCELAYPMDDKEICKPTELSNMLEICRKLSAGFDFVRVDLFLVEGKIYFSEMTFTPGNGMDRFIPRMYDYEFGRKWIIKER